MQEIVRATEQFRIAEAEGKLLRLPTGDGGAWFSAPVRKRRSCVRWKSVRRSRVIPNFAFGWEFTAVRSMKSRDLNEHANIAGAGINIAQRVMDCGDAGHILLSRHVADDLEPYRQWRLSP